MRIPFGKRSIL